MSNASYISVIERYREFHPAIRELMASILSSIGEEHVFDDKIVQCQAMEQLSETYPFLELLYMLDPDGIQLGDNVAVNSKHPAAFTGAGKVRSQRPYYRLAREADDIIVTDPYLSSANRNLCVTAATRWPLKGPTKHGYLALDIAHAKLNEYMLSDTARR